MKTIGDALRDLLAPGELESLFRGLASQSNLRDADGDPIEFDLKRGQHIYLYYPVGDWKFCYTPHRDTKGRYWSFVYQPIGKGSQSGNAEQWRIEGLRAARQRGTAKDRAIAARDRRRALVSSRRVNS